MAGLTSEELVERHRHLPRVDHELMRQEADEFFGTEDRVAAEPAESEQGRPRSGTMPERPQPLI